MQRFEDVLQQCACKRDRRSITVLQTGRESVIYKNIQRFVVSYKEERVNSRLNQKCFTLLVETLF